MSFDEPDQRLRDIVFNADRIGGYMADLGETDFSSDAKTIDAVERCLMRITEAVIKIGAERMSQVVPDVPFERIRGLGNRLRHAYDDLDTRIIYAIAVSDVVELRAAAARALES